MPTASTGLPRAGAHGTNSVGFDTYHISIRVDGHSVEDNDVRILNADLPDIAANVVAGTVPKPTGFFGPGFCGQKRTQHGNTHGATHNASLCAASWFWAVSGRGFLGPKSLGNYEGSARL